eukprot:6173982-Pleurochrysis_carterae.AAC.1
MAEMRRNLPHGFTVCSMLLISVAFISRGNVALGERYVYTRDAAETQVIYSAATRSMPSVAIAQTPKPCGLATREPACTA